MAQHGFMAVMPSGQLDVKPFDTPGLGVAAQATGGTFTVNATVSQANADKVVAAQSDFPVVAPARETLGGEYLGADDETLRVVGVVCLFLCHSGLSKLLSQRDASVGSPAVQRESWSIWKETKERTFNYQIRLLLSYDRNILTTFINLHFRSSLLFSVHARFAGMSEVSTLEEDKNVLVLE